MLCVGWFMVKSFTNSAEPRYLGPFIEKKIWIQGVLRINYREKK